MNYHSAKTIFSVTSSSGATQGKDAAERELKLEANSDICYLNTFPKQHPIAYQRIAGPKAEGVVSLRERHVILQMDNLVRLTFLENPGCGDGRSLQVCTLPITI